MTIDCHAKFAGIEGESKHTAHAGEIDVISFAWGVHNPSTFANGTGSGTGQAVPLEMSFKHFYDKASPTLAKSCISGKHFDEVVMTVRKAGNESQQDFLKFTLKEVFITGVMPVGERGGDLVEQVSLSYKDIEAAYKPQESSGDLGAEVKFGWNLEEKTTR